MRKVRMVKTTLLIVLIALVGVWGYARLNKHRMENAILKQVITRLEADSRVAEVLVTAVNFNEKTQEMFTTVKFLEYDSGGDPMEPRYFTFPGNIIQFQALVIRFDDIHIRRGDQLKGKSAFLFWKIFMLDGEKTKEYVINEIHEIPRGYKVEGVHHPYEADLWREFWDYALDAQKGERVGIKNAQIEAPGMMFVPGVLYTIKIEHDGGLRIDSSRLSPILIGEQILQSP